MNIDQLFSNYPASAQIKLRELRELIFEVAKHTKGVGQLKECLKWNELSFVTTETGSGSTFRIDWKEKDPSRYHIYFNCQTKLIAIFKELFPDDFSYGGNRCISLDLKRAIPKRKLSKCIEIALTYNSKNHKDFFKH